ncbi:hypothetical protein D0Y96_011190 [Acidipila sp. 4G-K13]|uniref:Lipoprotein n=2 Tax=Paracidobacterium acidisoli TaxID=2303751 RepID=A0A372IP32_9BACT|nr:hypothetical protein [Paracidobacterium acidisoli]
MRTTLTVALLALMTGMAGCHISVDKSKDGDNKNVRIDTPLGGLHVRSDDTSAADLGLPVYPGAQISPDSDGDKSADVHLGFGKWQLRVKAVTYQTADSQDKVVAFYKKAMARYGDVLQCDGDKTVGALTVTGEGLTCSEEHGKAHVNISDSGDLNLKAGSRHHQHIFALKKSSSGTRFALVELQLPEDLDRNSDTSD